MAFEIVLQGNAAVELRDLRAYDQRRIVGEMDRNLRHDPALETRHKKPLPGWVPSFEHVPPIWELRVGDFRVFYDVDPAAQVVNVRAVRRKDRQTTEEIT